VLYANRSGGSKRARDTSVSIREQSQGKPLFVFWAHERSLWKRRENERGEGATEWGEGSMHSLQKDFIGTDDEGWEKRSRLSNSAELTKAGGPCSRRLKKKSVLREKTGGGDHRCNLQGFEK